MKTKVFLSISGLAAALALSALLASCGSSKNELPAGPPPSPTNNIALPNITAGTNFGFDISAVSGTTYMITDRNNKAVDFVDIPSLTLKTQVTGTGTSAFAGLNPPPPAAANNALSGPDGNNPVGNFEYVGDVASVKIIDRTLTPPAIVKVITPPLSTTFRADEVCYDSTHNLFMISSPEETPPFATFINTTTQTVVATVKFGDSAGLEACGYDPVLDTFYVNNDGTPTNPHGELERLPGAAIRAIPAGGIVDYSTLTGLGRTSEGNCDPTGLALGPGTDLAVGCREGTTGAPLNFLIFNRSTGALLTTLNAGGGDQVWYDPTSNAYYNAASRWTASGVAATNGACSASSPCSPELIVINAATRKVAGFAPVGNNAHSVGVDPATGTIFVPYSSAAAPAGCGTCSDLGFINGGISVFKVSQFFH